MKWISSKQAQADHGPEKGTAGPVGRPARVGDGLRTLQRSVFDESRIHYYIEEEVFVYHASLSRGGDHLGGTLQVSDLSGTLIWQSVNISVERD